MIESLLHGAVLFEGLKPSNLLLLRQQLPPLSMLKLVTTIVYCHFWLKATKYFVKGNEWKARVIYYTYLSSRRPCREGTLFLP